MKKRIEHGQEGFGQAATCGLPVLLPIFPNFFPLLRKKGLRFVENVV